jgi:hypothetical protein
VLWRQRHSLFASRQRQAQNAEGGGKDKANDDDNYYDEEEMFLRLDDVLQGDQPPALLRAREALRSVPPAR